MKQFTKSEAIIFANQEGWKGMSDREIATLQLEQDKLCMPFAVFHRAIEETLGRPVFTHEFGMNRDGLKKELAGEIGAPSFADIVSQIPPKKLLIVAT